MLSFLNDTFNGILGAVAEGLIRRCWLAVGLPLLIRTGAVKLQCAVCCVQVRVVKDLRKEAITPRLPLYGSGTYDNAARYGTNAPADSDVVSEC